MKYFQDTIAAIVTAPMNAPVGIIRVSGVQAVNVLRKLFHKPGGGSFREFESHRNYYGCLISSDGTLLDRCLANFMRGPRSFTGEDVVELQCHGNVPLLKCIFKEVLSVAGVRAAEPGEFSKRAYLNGKLDLAQAEAIQEIVTASSEEAVHASLKNLDGQLSYIIEGLRGRVIEALALVEASFEFPDEDIETFNIKHLLEICTDLVTELDALSTAFQTSKLYDHGVKVAIVGSPNVGKSSLLNALLVEERAIVSDIAGTTRDVVEGARVINGIRFHFRDTAGIRETQDSIENLGIQRSLNEANQADCILCVVDDWRIDQGVSEILKQYPDKCILVRNKIDLYSGDGQLRQSQMAGLLSVTHARSIISTCSTSRGDIARLESELLKFFGAHQKRHNSVHINVRQFLDIQSSLELTSRLQTHLRSVSVREEILADELRVLADRLASITGAICSDDVLDDVFSKFCIGK